MDKHTIRILALALLSLHLLCSATIAQCKYTYASKLQLLSLIYLIFVMILIVFQAQQVSAYARAIFVLITMHVEI